ncbi:Protein of unknown function [Cotesia congregata]|uniref:Uncharacterized protein n=1 Tax=Cotesia congregata TaxID=51543 RepID=A0A8J2H8D5_COTCN|nr:Protein of unknown function [Cotesia congregata]
MIFVSPVPIVVKRHVGIRMAQMLVLLLAKKIHVNANTDMFATILAGASNLNIVQI